MELYNPVQRFEAQGFSDLILGNSIKVCFLNVVYRVCRKYQISVRKPSVFFKQLVFKMSCLPRIINIYKADI